MSKERLIAFMTLAQSDVALGVRAQEALTSPAGPDPFVALGKQRGFDFTAGDVAELYERAANGALSEQDLSEVAGGTSRAFFVPPPWNVIGAGVAAAIAVPIAIYNADHGAS